MTIPVRLLTPQGELVPASFSADSLDQVGAREPDGVYTIARTYRSDHVVMLDAHMDRLERSADLEGIQLDLDRSRLRSGLRRLIHEAGFPESRFRISIARHSPDTALLAVEPLRVISEQLRMTGVPAATICIDRPNPQAKSNRWIQPREQARRQLPDWAYEGLVCSPDGVILEGLSSNFYAVVKGKLRTARGTVLAGVARMILLKVAEGLVEISFEPVRLDELNALDEAMLTSSSRGILPIVRIDQDIIGTGEPGPVAQELWRRYQRWVEQNLEKI